MKEAGIVSVRVVCPIVQAVFEPRQGGGGAVAEAFSTACAKGDDIHVSDFDSIFKSEDAFAFAAVRLHIPLSTGLCRSALNISEAFS